MKQVREAIRDTVPVIAGYTVLGMGFGIVMSANGWSVWMSVAMSLFIYAGSMQYAAIGLFLGNASLITVALTTLAVNARHLFYGISMLDKYRSAGIKKPYLIFALTDETYSLVCHTGKGNDYCFLVSLFDHIYWVVGTLIGALVGNVIRFDLTGIEFALTALFVTVFTDQWIGNKAATGLNKNRIAALTGVGCSVLMLLLCGADGFLIPAMLLILLILLILPMFSNGKGAKE